MKGLSGIESELIDLVEQPLLVFGPGKRLLLHNSAAVSFAQHRLTRTLTVGMTFEGDEIRRLHPDLASALSRAFLGEEIRLIDVADASEQSLLLRPISKNGQVRAVAVSVESETASAKKRVRSGLSLALDRVASGVTVSSSEGDFGLIGVNRAFCEMTGYSRDELIGRNTRFLQDDLDQGDALDTLRDALEKRERCTVVLKNRRKNGDVFLNRLEIYPVFDESGEFVEFIGLQNDVTHEIQLEEAIEETRRLEAIGRMSSGLAHDFNNDLTVILQSAEFALDEISESHPIYEDLEHIRDAARHASRLARRLIEVGADKNSEVEVHQLDTIVQDISPLLRAMVRPRGHFVLDFEKGRPIETRIDRLEFERVILNLVSNAADAIEPDGTVTITLRARDGWAVLTVADDGLGMDSGLIKTIFQPYVTTKGRSGTGLGLPSSQQLLEGYGGSISVDSQPEAGTTFEIRIPLTLESDSFVESTDPLDD